MVRFFLLSRASCARFVSSVLLPALLDDPQTAHKHTTLIAVSGFVSSKSAFWELGAPGCMTKVREDRVGSVIFASCLLSALLPGSIG